MGGNSRTNSFVGPVQFVSLVRQFGAPALPGFTRRPIINHLVDINYVTVNIWRAAAMSREQKLDFGVGYMCTPTTSTKWQANHTILLDAIEKDTWRQIHLCIQPQEAPNKRLIPKQPHQQLISTRRATTGPCHFNHTTTSTIDAKGKPRWNAMPKYDARVNCEVWAAVPVGAPLCGKCYQQYATALRTGRPARCPATASTTPCWPHARPPG